MFSPKKDVAEKLRQYREACVLSQKQVADALNIERSTYTRYETGDSEPNLKMLVRIAAIYNVSPLQLLPTESVNAAERRRLSDITADSPIFQLSKEERGLIARYRALDKEEKKKAQEMIGNLSKKPE